MNATKLRNEIRRVGFKRFIKYFLIEKLAGNEVVIVNASIHTTENQFKYAPDDIVTDDDTGFICNCRWSAGVFIGINRKNKG